MIFVWTPPHFWALATLLREDYRRAGVPDAPGRGLRATDSDAAFVYAIAHGPASRRSRLLERSRTVYTVARGRPRWRVRVARGSVPARSDTATARRLFRASLVYLAALFAALVVDRMIAA